MKGYINSRTCGRKFIGRDMSSRSDVAHLTRSSPGKPPLARLVEMIADQLPERSRVVERELEGERHDAIRHAFAAVQAGELLFPRHPPQLAGPRPPSEGRAAVGRKRVGV